MFAVSYQVYEIRHATH